MTNNIFLDSDSIPEKARCFMCGQVKFVREAEIYYQGGCKLKLAYLCYNITNSSDVYTSSIIDSSCFHQYYDNLGYKLMVSDWYEDAYNTILSIFISSPLYTSSNTTT